MPYRDVDRRVLWERALADAKELAAEPADGAAEHVARLRRALSSLDRALIEALVAGPAAEAYAEHRALVVDMQVTMSALASRLATEARASVDPDEAARETPAPNAIRQPVVAARPAEPPRPAAPRDVARPDRARTSVSPEDERRMQIIGYIRLSFATEPAHRSRVRLSYVLAEEDEPRARYLPERVSYDHATIADDIAVLVQTRKDADAVLADLGVPRDDEVFAELDAIDDLVVRAREWLARNG